MADELTLGKTAHCAVFVDEVGDWQNFLTADGRKTTTYFGNCPTCHKNDGYIVVGKGNWFYCKEHKVKWFVGTILSSDETLEEQQAVYAALGFAEFTELPQSALWADVRWISPHWTNVARVENWPPDPDRPLEPGEQPGPYHPMARWAYPGQRSSGLKKIE